MKHALRFGLFVSLLVANFSILAAPLVIKSAVTAIEKQKIDAFLNGRSPLEIDRYYSPHLDSIAPVECVIFRKAVLLGGLDAVFEDVIVPNSVRSRASVLDGSVLNGGTAQWHIYYPAMSDHVLESDVVIPSGIYAKGLYVTKENRRRFNVKSRDDLKKLSAVTSNSWEVDWATLAGLELARLYSAPTRAAQFKMIKAGRADFTLQDFSGSPDLSIEEQGLRLYPLPGVKILLVGTRHYFINKDSPHSAAVFESLQKGLRLMKRAGEINRALLESGVANRVAAEWTALNP